MDTEQQGRAVWREEKQRSGRRRGKGDICDIYGLQGGTQHSLVGSSAYKTFSLLMHETTTTALEAVLLYIFYLSIHQLLLIKT